MMTEPRAWYYLKGFNSGRSGTPLDEAYLTEMESALETARIEDNGHPTGEAKGAYWQGWMDGTASYIAARATQAAEYSHTSGGEK